MFFIKAIIFGAGLYIGWNTLDDLNRILCRKYGKVINKKLQKILKVENKKNRIYRPVGFDSKWKES